MFKWFCVEFTPKKAIITIYFISDISVKEKLINQLGKYT